MLPTVVIEEALGDVAPLDVVLEHSGRFGLVRSIAACREGYELERELNVGPRSGFLLNRQCSNAPIQKDRIEESLGLPVEASFPDDYQTIHQALLTGKPLGVKTNFGSRCSRFARRLVELTSTNQPASATRGVNAPT